MRDDESSADARESGGHFVRERVDQVVLRRIAGQICERQHQDGSRAASAGVLRPTVAGRFALTNHQPTLPTRTSNAAILIANASRDPTGGCAEIGVASRC
jgi:hypothetical protein